MNPSGLTSEAGRYPLQGGICFINPRYPSRYGTTTANAKSVLSVLGACVKSGDEITFVCEGPDEEAALAAMVKIVEDGLGE